jgi:hypothetical protein
MNGSNVVSMVCVTRIHPGLIKGSIKDRIIPTTNPIMLVYGSSANNS